MRYSACTHCVFLLLGIGLCSPAAASPELWYAPDSGRLDAETGEVLGGFVRGGPELAPESFTLGADGYTYVGGYYQGHFIGRYDSVTYEFQDVFVSQGSGGLLVPQGMAFGADGNLYVASRGTDNILRYGKDGEFLGVFASTGLDAPEGITFGPDGDLYVASRATNEIRRYDGTTGESLGVFASGATLDGPFELRFRDDGKLYVSNYWGGSIAMFDAQTGESLGYLVEEQPPGILYTATGFDFGPDGNVYVGDDGYARIARFDGSTGEFIDIFSDHTLIGNVTFMQFVVPEPGSLLLLAAGGVTLLRRRR